MISDSSKIRFHVLIAGVHRPNVIRANMLWRRMSGTAVIGHYDPSLEGLENALKSITAEGNAEPYARLQEHHLYSDTGRALVQILPAELLPSKCLLDHPENAWTVSPNQESKPLAMKALWESLRTRCRSPKPPKFKSDDDRPVVCWRWIKQNGFKLCVRDMGERPSPKHRLRRIDKNAAYCPTN